jgi:hypothetical protein
MLQNQKVTSASSSSYVIQFGENDRGGGKPPQAPSRLHTPSSKSPSPVTHFHKCENKSCLNHHHHHQSSQIQRQSSFKTEAKLLINTDSSSPTPCPSAQPPTRITLKLLPEHRLAYKQYCLARHDQGQKRACSWSEDMNDALISKTRVFTTNETNTKAKTPQSPFTCIETISIKNTSSSSSSPMQQQQRFLRYGKSCGRGTRSLRSTPIRTITIKPIEVNKKRNNFFIQILNKHRILSFHKLSRITIFEKGFQNLLMELVFFNLF